MNSTAQSKLALVGLIALIAVALFFIIRQVAPARVTVPGTDWVCEQCEHRFIARDQWETRECPACRGEAVRTYFYYDTVNNELVEVYREKACPDSLHVVGIDEETGREITMYDPSVRLVKVPGGEWRKVESYPRDMEREIGFPVRVERPQDLVPAPPGSEYR